VLHNSPHIPNRKHPRLILRPPFLVSRMGFSYVAVSLIFYTRMALGRYTPDLHQGTKRKASLISWQYFLSMGSSFK
jgi:hypothetical protein